MRWKKIIEDSTLSQNVFKFNVTVDKKKEDGTTVHYAYNIDIPDLMVSLMVGERHVIEYIENQYIIGVESGSLNTFYTGLVLMVQGFANNFKYKWLAMIESNELYFNPLWNVDGVEITTEDIKKRQRDITDKFGNETAYTTQTQYGKDTNTIKHGNNQSYTEQMQYGLDETTHTTGTHTDVTTHKTNPFNDSDTLYKTGQDELAITQYDDKDSRALHTDTATYNPHTDVTERDLHTDTVTYNPHADTHKIEDAAHKDEITKERHGNIGITKSTELLRDYRDLPTEYYKPFLMDLMSYMSDGY